MKYCTIENHVYLWLALCVSTSSTGSSGPSDTRKNASSTDKRITNEKKMVQESKKSVFRAQYYSLWVIDRPQNFGLRLLIDYSLIIVNNQWLINWLLIDYSLITNWCHWSSISYVWVLPSRLSWFSNVPRGRASRIVALGGWGGGVGGRGEKYIFLLLPKLPPPPK